MEQRFLKTKNGRLMTLVFCAVALMLTAGCKDGLRDGVNDGVSSALSAVISAPVDYALDQIFAEP